MPLLEVSDVVAGYGRSEVLHSVSLAADEGSITALIGPNGAGKTTLAQALAGVVPARAGDVALDGESLNGLGARERALRGLGYTPQLRNVFTTLSVEDNLELVVRSMRLPDGLLAEVMDLFPILDERRKQRAGTLSGGQRQQLAIAASLLMRPRMLILDEPTTGLAPQIVDSLIEQIQVIARRGTGVLWIIEEHPRQILPWCERVHLMESGRIHHEASGTELLADPSFAEMFLGARLTQT